MRIYDIIQRKRDRQSLSDAEISYAVNGYTHGEIPDYQMSALLMAIFLNGMDKHELTSLTTAMMNSGETLDLSEFGDLTADKHSTGGVGDKTTLIVAPIVAALGCKVAKMSGRGLGHTGGTVDKLDSIPGFKTTLSREEFLRQVTDIGIAVIGSSSDLAPADKKIYALRDVTATIDSIPLIASSIMSKKLASGSKNIVLDVKTGSGAFMKTVDASTKLAETMVEIGRSCGRNISAVITNMDIPLGRAIGNAHEVNEAVEVLAGKGPDDLKEVSIELAAQLLCLCHGWEHDESIRKVKLTLESGAALQKFKDWIVYQGGSTQFIQNPSLLGNASYHYEYKAVSDGYISHMNTELIGKAAAALGAGRIKSDDTIDYTAGITLQFKTGNYCNHGDVIAVLYTAEHSRMSDACEYMDAALSYSITKPDPQPLIYGIVR